MSEGLLLYDGGLLFVDGGLTTDPNCCCYYEPQPDCPPCCIRIDWGTFDDDGNLVDNYVVSGIPITVKVSMPTPNSRIVCDTEQVTVRWELDAPSDNYGAWVRFGPGWGFGGESPSVGPDGETYDWGLVDWVGTSADAFQVILTFRKCFMDSAQFNYFIVIGTDFPDWDLDIESSRCTTPNECCPEEVDCEDCCALLDQEGVIKYDGKYYIVVNTVDPDGNIYTGVIEFELERAGILCKGEGIDITLWLVPPRHEDIENNTIIEFPAPWELGTYSPDVSVDDGDVAENRIDWGTLTKYRYDISLSIDCEEESCDTTLEFPTISITNTPFNVGAGIVFNECDMEDCCCPIICSCESSTHEDSIRCYWPIDSECDEDNPLDQWEIGGATQVTNFDCLVNFDGPIVTYVQNGVSEHRFSCYLIRDGVWCKKSEHEIKVPVLFTSGEATEQKYIHIFLSNEGNGSDPCNYRLRMDGLEFPYWPWPEQVSDCERASVSFVPGGIPGYTADTSFDIEGSIPCPCGES